MSNNNAFASTFPRYDYVEKEVERTITETQEVFEEVGTTVSLTMDLADAEVLRRVAFHTGGSPQGPRGAIDRISRALKDAGVNIPEKVQTGMGVSDGGSFIFLRAIEEPEPEPEKTREQKYNDGDLCMVGVEQCNCNETPPGSGFIYGECNV